MTSRNTILECALELFTSRGYEAVGVQEVVEAAGVTKPTLYHFFSSKRGLLQTLIEEQSRDLIQGLMDEAVYHGDLTLTLEKIVAIYFRFAREHPRYYRMQLSLWFAPPESEAFRVVNEINMQQHRVLEKVFTEAVADHGNLGGRQTAYAATFLGMINTYAGMALNGFMELTDRLVTQTVHQFMHGIFS